MAVAISRPANQSVTIFDIKTLSSTPPVPATSRGPGRHKSHDGAAQDHQRQTGEHDRPIAETPPDAAAGISERHAGCQIEAKQHTNIGERQSHIARNQRRDRRHALILEPHGRSHGK
jgi:hypothetical protein